MDNILELRLFDDLHCHFRDGDMLKNVLPHTARYCGRAIAMPNLRPRAILNAVDAVLYQHRIILALDSLKLDHAFSPLMTIEIRDSTIPEVIKEAKEAGVVAGKVYPLGVTTNSDAGLRNFFDPRVLKTFEAMQEAGMLLLIHGEVDKPHTLVTKREEVFLPTLVTLAEMFPSLKIVLEHVSSKAGVHAVESLGANVAATITGHHLLLTLNDVIGYGIQPHNACMPTPKDFPDRDSLLAAAMSGNHKFFLGSDTAPHLRQNKECSRGACGVYSAPVLPQVLADVFEKAGHLDRLENFTSVFGAEFYGLPLNEGRIILVKEEWQVPAEIDGIVPFKAGEKLLWQLA